jgi:CBS domain-containing protein
MRARNIASRHATVSADSPAVEAADILSRHDVRGILVVDASGGFVDVLSDSELLRDLLPPYVDVASVLAHVLEESAADALFRRLEGRTVGDLLRSEREVAPVVDAGDTLVEVASVMVRAHASLVGVLDGGVLVGGISIDDLLSHLLARR